jgi:hypothetical protein
MGASYFHSITIPARAFPSLLIRNVMKTKLKKTILISVILIAFSCNRYKEYIPQIFNGNELVEVPEMITEKHRKNVINVLKYYGEEWKLENEKLLVFKKIDNEILWNYTTKANDSTWLIEHKSK